MPGRWPSARCCSSRPAWVRGRPALLWDRLYDVVLFNAPYVFAAAVCWLRRRGASAPSAPPGGPSRSPSLLSAAGNVAAHLGGRADGDGPYPLLADVLLALAGYLPLYVTLVVLIRARVPRFHPSMWLDGVIGALGAVGGRASPSCSGRICTGADRPRRGCR